MNLVVDLWIADLCLTNVKWRFSNEAYFITLYLLLIAMLVRLNFGITNENLKMCPWGKKPSMYPDIGIFFPLEIVYVDYKHLKHIFVLFFSSVSHLICIFAYFGMHVIYL